MGGLKWVLTLSRLSRFSPPLPLVEPLTGKRAYVASILLQKSAAQQYLDLILLYFLHSLA